MLRVDKALCEILGADVAAIYIEESYDMTLDRAARKRFVTQRPEDDHSAVIRQAMTNMRRSDVIFERDKP